MPSDPDHGLIFDRVPQGIRPHCATKPIEFIDLQPSARDLAFEGIFRAEQIRMCEASMLPADLLYSPGRALRTPDGEAVAHTHTHVGKTKANRDER